MGLKLTLAYALLIFVNRTAQRAFRERKQSQLVELQTRIQSYEEGEIERSVALQKVAKRLKEENNQLRHENQLLRGKIARMEEQESVQNRSEREQSPAPKTSSRLQTQATDKRAELSTNVSNAISPAVLYVPSVPSTPSSPDSKGISKSTYGSVSHPSDKKQDQGSSHILGYNETKVYSDIGCGFCNKVMPCLCHEIATQNPSGRAAGSDEQMSTTIYPQPKHPTHIHIDFGETSILDDLPAYQPAIPLPRKRVTSMNSIFPVVQLPSQGLSPALCSGDPSNCLACADDTFGKAFCTAISRSIASQSPCVDCPFRNDVADSRGRHSYENPSSSTSGNMTDSETMPTNEAWKKIKEHPNVSFADLNLLAEVVARRSKCTGPTVVISPAPGEVTPERMASPNVDSQSYSVQDLFLPSDTRTCTGTKERSASLGLTSPQQNVIIGCGRTKISEVYVEGVQDALSLLNKNLYS